MILIKIWNTSFPTDALLRTYCATKTPKTGTLSKDIEIEKLGTFLTGCNVSPLFVVYCFLHFVRRFYSATFEIQCCLGDAPVQEITFLYTIKFVQTICGCTFIQPK